MSADLAPTRFEARAADWLGVEEARARILRLAAPLGEERVALLDSVGRALAEQIVATATLPPWDNSAMDGYAVRGADIEHAGSSEPVVLRVVGLVRAGGAPGPTVGRGEAVRIMTGAPLPPGADTVVRVEDTDAEATQGRVSVLRGRDRGRNVRPGGRDMRPGDRLLEVGDTIGPGTVALLAAAGRDTVTVHRAPTVAILATGDELRTSERYEDVRRGAAIPESNGPMLAAMARTAGALALPLGIAADDPADLRDRIGAAAHADVLVTVGGASMGEADLVKRVLDELGFTLDFWRVRMRPGSPVSFGWLARGDRRQPVFGLPGNPASAFVTFEVFVRPFLRALAGHRRVLRPVVSCACGESMTAAVGLTHFLRVTLDGSDGRTSVRLAGPQGSGLVSSLARADGLAIVPEDVERLEVGESVAVMLLDPGAAG